MKKEKNQFIYHRGEERSIYISNIIRRQIETLLAGVGGGKECFFVQYTRTNEIIIGEKKEERVNNNWHWIHCWPHRGLHRVYTRRFCNLSMPLLIHHCNQQQHRNIENVSLTERKANAQSQIVESRTACRIVGIFFISIVIIRCYIEIFVIIDNNQFSSWLILEEEIFPCNENHQLISGTYNTTSNRIGDARTDILQMLSIIIEYSNEM